MAMRRMGKVFGRVLGALLAAALALSPVVTFAHASSPPSGDAMAMHESAPCDMPCDDCADEAPSPACMIACSGLIAAIPSIDAVAQPQVAAARAATVLTDLFNDRRREPDKPPPRPILA
jgi:hypothetical protein